MTDVSIIIPSRNEQWLNWTIENIKRTCNPLEIIVVYDGLQRIDRFDGAKHIETPWTTPQGVGKCRDYGAMMARGDYLVFLDAHMDFAEGWLEKLIKPIKEDKNTATCAKSYKITPPHGLKRPGKLNAGAVIREFGTSTGRPLEVEWLPDPMEPGEVQCILGACYAIHSDRYIDLGRPWAGAFGWGTSEQTLCMVNELAGGKNVLTDAVSGHYYMEADKRGFIPDADFKTGSLFNRLRLIRMIYGDDCINTLNRDIRCSKFKPYSEKALEMLENTDDTAIIRKFKVKIEDYRQKWWGKQEDNPVTPQPAPRKMYNPDIDERFV